MTKNSKSDKKITLTNYMKGLYYLPQGLLFGQIKNNTPSEVGRNISRSIKNMKSLKPNDSIGVDKSSFDVYYKGSKAFKYLVDMKLLGINTKKRKSNEDLKNPSKPEIPVELTNEGLKDNVSIGIK